jgi:serine/threonine-protein kinase
VLGTPEYMAPEQARAESIDHRVDLFALGVIMYRLLTGKMPYDGKGMKVTLENMTTPTPRMRERAPEVAVDPLLEVFARWLMAKNPGSRPRSAAEARTVLRMIATNRNMAAMCMPAGPETQATLSPAMIAACRLSLRTAV